jgi:hypothetical protein
MTEYLDKWDGDIIRALRFQDEEICELAADEIERLRAEMNARDPVDAMDRGMSPVEAAVYHVWGERCSDFEPGCTTCKAWAEFDKIKRRRAALETLSKYKANEDDMDWYDTVLEMNVIARAALAQGGE